MLRWKIFAYFEHMVFDTQFYLRRFLFLENVAAILSQAEGCRDVFNFIEKDQAILLISLERLQAGHCIKLSLSRLLF